MAKKRRRKKQPRITRASMGIVGGTATLGVGASVLGGIGGTAAHSGQRATQRLAGYTPTMATAAGGGVVIGMLNNITPKKKKRGSNNVDYDVYDYGFA